jgi:hypothetical protein
MARVITTSAQISFETIDIPETLLGSALQWWIIALQGHGEHDDDIANRSLSRIKFTLSKASTFVPKAYYLKWPNIKALVEAYDRHRAAGHRHTLALCDFSGLLVAFEDPCGNSVWHRIKLPNSDLGSPAQTHLLSQCYVGMPIDIDSISRTLKVGGSLESLLNCDSITIGDVERQRDLALSIFP